MTDKKSEKNVEKMTEKAAVKFALKSITTILTLACAGAALAEGKLALEEIIVTAQKKEASLQDTPIALDAFGEDALEREGINNVGDLANNVPALTIEPFPINNTTLRIYIRGIGLIDAQVTQDPPVGVYIDGAYIARSSGLATDVADLTRIEVLRGPQGTLYGRNSTGGAVNLVTKRPNVDEIEVKQAFTIGNRNLITSKTSVNLPLWEGAAAKLAYYQKDIDGHISNNGGGGSYGDNETIGYRLDFGWDVSDTVRLDYAFDRSEVEHYNYTYDVVNPSTDLDTGAATDGFQNLIRAGARQFYNYNSSNHRRSQINSSVPLLQSDTDIHGHQFSVVWSASDNFEVKYIYAQRELFDGAAIDLGTGASSEGYRLDNNAVFSFAVDPDINGTGTCRVACTRNTQYGDRRPDLLQEQFSHELQFSGSFFEDRLSYIAGIYYFEETGDEDNGDVHHQLSAPLGDTGVGARIEVLTQQVATIDNTAMALFSQTTYRPPILDDRLSFTLGARHSEDSRKASIFRRLTTYMVTSAGSNLERQMADVGTLLTDDVIQGVGDRDFADDSFSFTIEYAMTDEINFYLKQNEAYKSGGFNIREPVTADGQARFDKGFDEEKVTSVELGMKARFLDSRLQVNADVFEQTFEDQQLNFTILGSLTDTTVANAGTSTLRGFEMDTTFLAARGLIFILNYAYLESEIDTTTNPLSGEPDDDFVFNSAPQNAYTFAVDWTLFQHDNYGRLSLNAVYSFTDERNGGGRVPFATQEFDANDDFAVVNARLGLYDIPAYGGDLTLALWGKNLDNENYTINNVHNLPQADRASLYGEPRTYGLDLIYRWSN